MRRLKEEEENRKKLAKANADADEERRRRLEAQQRLKDMEKMQQDWNLQQKLDADRRAAERAKADKLDHEISPSKTKRVVLHMMKFPLSRAFNTMRDEAATRKRIMRLIHREIMKRRNISLSTCLFHLREYAEAIKIHEMELQAYLLNSTLSSSPRSSPKNSPKTGGGGAGG